MVWACIQLRREEYVLGKRLEESDGDGGAREKERKAKEEVVG